MWEEVIIMYILSIFSSCHLRSRFVQTSNILIIIYCVIFFFETFLLFLVLCRARDDDETLGWWEKTPTERNFSSRASSLAGWTTRVEELLCHHLNVFLPMKLKNFLLWILSPRRTEKRKDNIKVIFHVAHEMTMNNGDFSFIFGGKLADSSSVSRNTPVQCHTEVISFLYL